MPKTQTGTKIFYGYIVVLASLLILVVIHGISASYGVFFNPLEREFGWDRAAISGVSSLAFFLMGFFSTVAGRLTDRYGPKLTMAVSSLILGMGYLLVSRVHSVWQLYLCYGVIVGMGLGGGDVVLLPTVARWFVKRRSLMSSIVKVGTGIGIFVVPLVAAWLIVNYNWRTAYAVLAAIVVVSTLTFSRLLKRDPAEIGAQPYGAVNGATSSQGIWSVNLTLREVLRTWQFWVLCAAYFLIWYSTQSVMVHIAPRAIDSGFSAGQAASVISVIGGVSIVGRLTMGGAGDRIGNRRALVICFVVLLVALIWLQFARELWMLYLFALVYGFAHGGFFAIVSPLVAELFGTTFHATNLGMLFFIGMTGGALGPIVAGRMFDVTHTYRLAFLILVFAAGVGLVLALFMKPVKPEKQTMRTTV